MIHKSSITITGPHQAQEIGSCNACTRATTDGAAAQTVHEITLRQLSFRLCPICYAQLIAQMTRMTHMQQERMRIMEIEFQCGGVRIEPTVLLGGKVRLLSDILSMTPAQYALFFDLLSDTDKYALSTALVAFIGPGLIPKP